MESTSIEKKFIRNKIAASGLPNFLDMRDCSGTLGSVASSSAPSGCRTRIKFFGAMRQDQNRELLDVGELFCV